MVSRFMRRLYENVFTNQITEHIPADMKPQVFMFRITGIWPSQDDSLAYTILTTVCFGLWGFAFPLSLIINVFYADAIEDVMDSLFISATCLNTTFRAAVVYSQRSNIRRLFRIHVDLMRNCDRDGNQMFRNVVHLNVNVFRFLLCFYSAACGIIIPQVALCKRENGIWPSTSRMPYAFANKQWVYLSALLFQILCSYGIIFWTAVGDAYPVALMNMTCGHVTHLKMRLRNLGAKYSKQMNRDREFYTDLIECCKHYEACLRIVAILSFP